MLKYHSHYNLFMFSPLFLISSLSSRYIFDLRVSPTMVTALPYIALLALPELAYARPYSVSSVVQRSDFPFANAMPTIKETVTAIGGAQALDSISGLQYEASTPATLCSMYTSY